MRDGGVRPRVVLREAEQRRGAGGQVRSEDGPDAGGGAVFGRGDGEAVFHGQRIRRPRAQGLRRGDLGVHAQGGVLRVEDPEGMGRQGLFHGGDLSDFGEAGVGVFGLDVDGRGPEFIGTRRAPGALRHAGAEGNVPALTGGRHLNSLLRLDRRPLRVGRDESDRVDRRRRKGSRRRTRRAVRLRQALHHPGARRGPRRHRLRLARPRRPFR
mmetsp:Transcript_14752/g.48189  ORF Transcript_14752/g.48189 Transcript_14752/m.48189 type:complete len:212 (-) Transcript_14752:1517-2152(-)